MCGFAGLMDKLAGVSELRGKALRMTASLAHRGPDAEGLFVEDGVALGHRRLSILDLSPAGAQPMIMEENGPVIVFNGEIYNFRKLREELSRRGRSFAGHSDTEVVLQVYDEYGLEGLTRIEGIFALAIWDRKLGRLLLMRDRLGVKPLFYSHNGSQLAFGSEIKSVLAVGGINTDIDSQALSEYLWYGNSYEERTIYAGIRSLLPGHWLIVEGAAARMKPWWKLEDWLTPDSPAASEREAAVMVREALDAAVKRQLVADVPVGIFLSGGIDSSGIAASAMKVQQTPLNSYSVGFDFDKGVNELPKARQVAEHLGLTHHEIHVGGTDLQDVLVSLARCHDEPFADAANIPLFLLSRQISGSIKVVLQGDGGDEMFAGYRRYSMLRHAALWRKWPDTLTPLVKAGFGSRGDRFARMADALGAGSPEMRMALLLTTETLQDPPTKFFGVEARKRFAIETDPFLAYRNAARRFPNAEPVQQMLLTDIALELPSRFLAKVDRATMANGLESRVPFLDENVVRLAVNLPSKWKASGAQKKVVLRNALRGRVPDSILDGPKTGFGVPYEYWLKTSLFGFARDAVLDGGFIRRFGFDGKTLESAFVDCRQGAKDRASTLWKILQLALWAKAGS